MALPFRAEMARVAETLYRCMLALTKRRTRLKGRVQREPELCDVRRRRLVPHSLKALGRSQRERDGLAREHIQQVSPLPILPRLAPQRRFFLRRESGGEMRTPSQDGRSPQVRYVPSLQRRSAGHLPLLVLQPRPSSQPPASPRRQSCLSSSFQSRNRPSCARGVA
eukprot:scaffold1726_cov260-Pinguiococcus_pyrenoidosus.AAC.37